MKLNFVYIDRCHHTSRICMKYVGAHFVRIPKVALHPLSAVLTSFLMSFGRYPSKVFLCESPISTLIPIFRRIFEKNKIIYRGIDPFFDPRSTDYTATSNWLKRRILFWIIGNIDGVYCETPRGRDDALRANPDFKYEICTVFADKFDQFSKITPAKNKNTVIVGEFIPPLDVKNSQMMIDLFSTLNVDAKLYVLGKNTQKLAVHDRRITVLGFGNIVEYFKKSRFILHLSKYEGGPTVILEALAAGLIPIISNRCGYSSIIEKLDPLLVINIDKPIAPQVQKVYSLSDKRLDALAKKAKQMGKKYQKEKILPEFKRKLEKLIKK